MSAVRTITVKHDEAELRLDRWFRRHFPQVAHGRLEKLLRTGQVRVDGRRAKSGTRLAAGQVIRVPPLTGERPGRARPGARAAAPGPRDIEALRGAVLFRDDAVIAIDKPAGLAVQGGTGLRRHVDAMLDALRFEQSERPRLVHRLDKDTSGVLLLARTAPAARRLSAAFRGKAAQKLYWGLVVGVPKPRRGRIDLPLGKRAGRGGETVGAVPDAGKPALSLYQVVDTHTLERTAITWLVLMPLTGRTHQLRAHCAALGTPILCDGKFGGRAAFPEALPLGRDGGIPKQLMLLAREIAVPHPEDDTTLRVAAPLPPHMAAAWAALGFDTAKGERAGHDLIRYAEGLAHSPPGAQRAPKREHASPAGRAKR